MNPTTEKSSSVVADVLSPTQPIPEDGLKDFGEVRETREVFKAHVDGVAFRTVSWQRATILFLKIQFAMSILAVPSALAALGAVGGALSIVGWGALNACESPPLLKSAWKAWPLLGLTVLRRHGVTHWRLPPSTSRMSQ